MNLTQAPLREPAIAAAVEVLDTMFFELPVDSPQPCDRAPQDGLCALVQFAGTADGSLAVWLEQPPLLRLAALFLGLEEGAMTEGMSANVLCELANMICGSTLSRLNPGGRIVISPPRLVALSEVSPAVWVRFPLECGSLAISLTYRGL